MSPSRSIPPLPPDLRAWMEEQPAPERAALAEVWEAAEGARPPAASPDPARKAAVWAVLEAALDEAAPGAPSVAPVRRRAPEAAPSRPARLRLVRPATLRWMAAAAVVAVLFGIGIGYWLQPVTLTAPAGTTQVATLPDGSRVHLNSGSTLAHDRRFTGDTRHVALEGEAFFEVVPDARQPFVVETFNARTTVLGTSFNVRARAGDVGAETAVVVATGRVRVAPRSAPEAGVVLTPGMTASLPLAASAIVLPDSVELSRALAWRTGGFAFRNQPLGSIFAEIGRRYDVTVEANPEVMLRPSTYYKHTPSGAEDMLKEITFATGLHYRKTANGFEVYTP